jgi:hypothetical protein
MPVPFKSGNPGKPKGAVNKTTKLVKETFAKVFDQLQDDPYVNLAAWAKTEPTEFYKLASKLIPAQITMDVTSFNLMTLDPLTPTDATEPNDSTTEDSQS